MVRCIFWEANKAGSRRQSMLVMRLRLRGSVCGKLATGKEASNRFGFARATCDRFLMNDRRRLPGKRASTDRCRDPATLKFGLIESVQRCVHNIPGMESTERCISWLSVGDDHHVVRSDPDRKL